MKPKISTGYLTPQAKKGISASRRRLSESEENEAENLGFDENFFQTLLRCPQKKKMVLQLLAANKEAIDKYKKKGVANSGASPVVKLKAQKNKTCESPTALLRRRALEQMNTSSSASNRSGSSRRNSSSSESSSHQSSTVPFEKLLEGVIAYVEIKSRLDADRSGGAKAVLKSMGATIRDTFTRDVTHVIFKDGLYTTFQKAKLKKVHLVSILWVEFCRKTMQRQSEKQYPAMRSGFDDETMICSQMQKEYEDIIREEYRRSIVQGTPLPTTQSLINRRRTLMTPTISNMNTSSSSFKTAEDRASSQELSDREVASINGFQTKDNISDESLVPESFSDVSGPVVNGTIVEKENHVTQSILESIEQANCSDMELTNIAVQSPIESDGKLIRKSKQVLTNNVVAEIPRNQSRNVSSTLFGRRKTICSSLLSSDTSTKSLTSADKSSTNTSLISSDKSTNITDEVSFAKPKDGSKKTRRLTRGISSCLLESESFIFGRNSVKAKNVLTTELDKTASAMSELKLSSNNGISKSTSKSNSKSSHQISTSMSSLRISSESKKGTSMSDLKLTPEKPKIRISSAKKSSSNSAVLPSGGDAYDTSRSSLMSELQIAINKLPLNKNRTSTASLSPSPENSSPNKAVSRKNKRVEKNSSFSSSDNSNPITIKPAVENIIRALQTSEFITIRKRGAVSRGSDSTTSGDSEIISPKRNVKRTHSTKNAEINNFDDNSENVCSKNSQSNPLGNPNTLVVNIVRSPLVNLDNLGNHSKNRRKTLGSRGGSKQEVPSSIRTRRKTMSSQVQKDSDVDTPPKLPHHVTADSVNDNSNNPTKTKQKFFKLYNPDDSLHIEIDDEREREENRKQAQKRKPDQGVNPLEIFKPLYKPLSNEEASSDSDVREPTPPKRTRKAKQKNEPVQLNSSADEQKELLDEVLRKKNKTSVSRSKPNILAETPSRRSTRIKFPTQKTQNSTTCVAKYPTTPRNRRSTLEFMSLSQLTSSKKKLNKKIDKTKQPTIVCTKLHKADVQMFTQIVKKLGVFNVEDEVSDRTTHVVAGEPKRTINMLRAVTRGCWILTFEWVLQSLEEGKWLPEEDFEVTDFSPVIQKCRLERQAFGKRYAMDVFESCPPIYVAPSTSPRCSDLKELITTCKGRIVTTPRMARIVVGQYLNQEDTVCVNETWVLDCITFYKKLSFKQKYLVGNKRKSLVV